MNIIMNNAHLVRVVILGLVPSICCPIDRKQMLGTSPRLSGLNFVTIGGSSDRDWREGCFL
ncbi:hypothetical protein CPT32_05945, partial [Rhizobium sophoriradicis]